MASGKAEGASGAAATKAKAGEAEAAAQAEEPDVVAAPSAEDASAAEIAALREQLAQATAVAEQAGEVAEQSERRAAEARAEAALLREAQTALDEAPAGTVLSDRLADVLEKLGERLAAPVGPVQTFRPGESVADVVRSLEGRISVPEASGRTGEVKVYISKGNNHRIVKRGRVRSTDAHGNLQVTPGFHIPFEPDGRFETDDLDVQEFLEARPAFGVEFWELGNDPTAAPDPQPVLDTILEAAMELDDDRLASIEAQEETGPKREVVLKQVRAARRRVQNLDQGAPSDGAEVVA